MTANIGKLDRIIRLVVGIVLLILAAFSLTGTPQVLALVVGIVAVATAGMRFCPAYRLLGIKTCQL